MKNVSPGAHADFLVSVTNCGKEYYEIMPMDWESPDLQFVVNVLT